MKVELLGIDEKSYRALDMESYSSIAAFQRLGLDYKREVKDSPQFSEEDYIVGSVIDTVISEELDPHEYVEEKYVTVKEKPSSLKMKLLSLLFTIKTNKELPPEMIDEILLNNDPSQLSLIASVFYKKKGNISIDEKDRIYFRMLDYAAKYSKVGIISDYQKHVIFSGVRCIRKHCEEIATVDPKNVLSQIFYQRKFAFEVKGMKIKCMLDMIHVDHVKKEITPIDLKTSMNGYDKIMSSFSKYGYYIQAGLYRLATVNFFKNHPMYRDYKVKEFKFVFYHIKGGEYSEFVVSKELYMDSFKMRLLYDITYPSLIKKPYYDDEYINNEFYSDREKFKEKQEQHLFEEKDPSMELRANNRKGIIQLLEEMSLLNSLRFPPGIAPPFYKEMTPTWDLFGTNYGSRDGQLYQYFLIDRNEIVSNA
jgi:hypothetical protein